MMLKLPLKLALLLLAVVSAGILWQQGQLAVLALSRIDPIPETREMVAAGHYAEAARYLDFFMEYDYVNQDPAAQALHAQIEQERGRAAYQAGKLKEGLFDGTSDETIGQAVGVASDLFVIGDLRDLTKQAINWGQGAEVDEVVAALAGIGVAATTAQVVSAMATVGSGGAAAPAVGAATAVKGGVIMLKAAKKLGKFPSWLGKAVLDGAAAVKRSGKLDAVSDLFGNVYTLAKTRGGFELLSHTTDAASLRRMATFTETFGNHSATLYRIGGDQALKVAQRAGDLGAATIKQAATFGQGGLRVLDKLGTFRFIKFSARAGKIAYKGDAIQLLARLLMDVPNWLLYLFVGLGAAVWVPWGGMARLKPWTPEPGRWPGR
ncbi:hypothetical protein [uncultured Thiodictyon sp.]|uniref:hypothetical protein n=1 Tax=uncultured Thiodictyon sp. TaxID=1846217 RepID=UPI0025DD905D|nr:hypothetical protein [uncultured Thiodictyon sp.]